MNRPVQTNERGRSGSLLGGFLLIAQRTGLPLRLLEIGSSAGLNLCWDSATNGPAAVGAIRRRLCAWGPSSSDGAPPPAAATVVERAGCDPDPVDVHSPEGRLTLLACTLPDQLERIRLLEAAVAIARGVSYRVDPASAADWLESRLARPAAGVATVIFHFIASSGPTWRNPSGCE